MTKRTKPILLIAVLAMATILGACSSSESPKSTDNPGNAGGNPVDLEETVELTWAVINFGKMDDAKQVSEEISKITKEKINVTVNLVGIDVSAWNQQMNLMLASNEKLDLVVTSPFFGYANQVAKGQLIPLDELLAQYGAGIKSTMPEAMYNGTKVSGKIYGVPSIRDFASDFGIIMRKDLIEAHDIDASTLGTWTDLEPVFDKIKANEPTIYPLVQNTQTQTIAQMMYQGKIDPLVDFLGVLNIEDDNLTVVNLFEQPYYKETIELVHKWYKSGYINPDVATTTETAISLIAANKAFSSLSNMKPGFAEQESRPMGKEMIQVSFTDPISVSTSASAYMLSIPRNSKHPEKAMELMNLIYTDPDIVNLYTNGIEGTHYVKSSDGLLTLPEGTTETGYQFNQWQVGNNFLSHVWEGMSPDIWEQTKAFNDNAVVAKTLGFLYDMNSVKTEVAAVTNVVNKYKVGLESGVLDPSNLDKFNKELKSAGLDKIIAEKQRQIDAWASSK